MRFLLILCLLLPSISVAKVKIPCLTKNKRGKWVAQKKTECIQYTRAEQEDNNKKLIQLKWYIHDYSKLREKIEADYKKLDSNWKSTKILWTNQLKHHSELKKELKGQARDWKEAFQKLQKERAPRKAWYDSKALWLSVGIVAGVAATSAVAYVIISATRP